MKLQSTILTNIVEKVAKNYRKQIRTGGDKSTRIKLKKRPSR